MKHHWTINERLDGVCKRCGAVWNGDNRNHECDLGEAQGSLFGAVELNDAQGTVFGAAEPSDTELAKFVGEADGE